MATVREKIVALVETKLKLIATPTFAVTVKRVFRSQKEAVSVTQHPSLIIDDFGDDRTWHLSKAYQARMRLTVQVVEHDQRVSVGPTEVALVLGEVEKQIVANEFWNDGSEDLAVATFVARNAPSLGEAEKPIGTDRLDIEIVYRTAQDNPDTVRII